MDRKAPASYEQGIRVYASYGGGWLYASYEQGLYASHGRGVYAKLKGLPLKLKGRLYSAFVHSVLLYNSEVWTITETELKALVGRNGYLMRRLVGK